jgi:hypothetical protein
MWATHSRYLINISMENGLHMEKNKRDSLFYNQIRVECSVLQIISWFVLYKQEEIHGNRYSDVWAAV